MTARISETPAARASNPDGGLPGRVAEFFSLRSRKTAARARVFSPADPGFREFELGLAALRNAIQLGAATREAGTGLLLARSALGLLVLARSMRTRGAAERLSSSEAWASFTTDSNRWAELESAVGAAVAGHLRRAMNDDGEAHLANFSTNERDQVLLAMIALAQQVAAPLEDDASAVRRATWVARGRIAFAAALVLLPLGWCAGRLGASPNLAYHKHVVVSDSDASLHVDPRHVVDGDRTNLGFHTTARSGTNVTIDLGDARTIRRIEIYNRADCCLERVVPLTVELSTDGAEYRSVARNAVIFDRWTVRLPADTTARFVRLTHGSATYFHLSEVEVY